VQRAAAHGVEFHVAGEMERDVADRRRWKAVQGEAVHVVSFGSGVSSRRRGGDPSFPPVVRPYSPFPDDIGLSGVAGSHGQS
jgi:hypothetical protein